MNITINNYKNYRHKEYILSTPTINIEAETFYDTGITIFYVYYRPITEHYDCILNRAKTLEEAIEIATRLIEENDK